MIHIPTKYYQSIFKHIGVKVEITPEKGDYHKREKVNEVILARNTPSKPHIQTNSILSKVSKVIEVVVCPKFYLTTPMKGKNL